MIRTINRTINTVLAVFVWTFITLDTALVFLAIAIIKPFDRNEKMSYHIANFWGNSIIRLNPFWQMKIQGTHHIKDNTGYVLVANHSSLADIVCLYCMGKHFKWLAKASLFKIPVFGWTMSLLNYIPLKRGEHGSIRDSFREAQEWLERDISVLFFPEGTRSRSGTLGEFKNGAFKLAILTKKPVIPIVIQGTGAALSKGRAMMATKVRGSLKVLSPVDVDAYQPEEYDALKTKVWNLMAEELTQV